MFRLKGVPDIQVTLCLLAFVQGQQRFIGEQLSQQVGVFFENYRTIKVIITRWELVVFLGETYFLTNIKLCQHKILTQLKDFAIIVLGSIQP